MLQIFVLCLKYKNCQENGLGHICITIADSGTFEDDRRHASKWVAIPGVHPAISRIEALVQNA